MKYVPTALGILLLSLIHVRGYAQDVTGAPLISNRIYTQHLMEVTGNRPEILEIENRQTATNKRNFRSYLRRSLRDAGFKPSQLSDMEFQLTVAQMQQIKKSNPSILNPEKVGTNVIAEIQGTDLADEVIVISAHYDTVPNTAGANDNGTGTAAVMTMAKAMLNGKFSPRRTLKFVFFDYEEMGLLGSQAYFRNSLLNDNIALALNLDMIGYSPKTSNFGYGVAFSAGPFQNTIGQYLKQVADMSDTPLEIDGRLDHGSFPTPDNSPFRIYTEHLNYRGLRRYAPSDALSAITMGIPATTFIENSTEWTQHVTMRFPYHVFYPHFHKPSDQVDKINFDFATDVTQLVSNLAFAAANQTGNPWDTEAARSQRSIMKQHFIDKACASLLSASR